MSVGEDLIEGMENAVKYVNQPTHSTTRGKIHVARVVDAVNSIPNEAARRMAIAALKLHAPEGTWFTRRGGFLGT